MSTLDHYRPKVELGEIIECGDRVLFRITKTGKLLSVPSSIAPVLLLMDGTRTLSQLTRVIYERKGDVPFQELLLLLRQLNQANALADDLALFESKLLFLKRRSIFSETIWEFRFWSTSWMRAPLRVRPMGFAAVSLLILAVGIYGYFKAPSLSALLRDHGVFRMNGSHFIGLLGGFLFFSLARTCQGLLTALLSWVGIGRLPVTLTLTPVSFSLSCDDENILGLLNRSQKYMYWSASVASPFFMLAMTLWISHSEPIYATALTAAVLALLSDLNPFDPYSRICRLFKAFSLRSEFDDLLAFTEKKSLFGSLRRGGHSPVQVSFATFSVIWMMGAYSVFSTLIERGIPHIALALTDGLFIEQVSAVAVLGVFGGLYGVMCFHVLRLLGLNAFDIIETPWLLWKKRRLELHVEKPKFESVEMRLRQVQLFDGLRGEDLRSLYSACTYRSFQDGAPIIIQDTPGSEMFILLKGQARVRRRDADGRTKEVMQLIAPTVFGELAIFNKAPRSADVIATGRVKVLVLGQPQWETLHQQYGDTGWTMVRDRIMLQQAISTSTLFRHLPGETTKVFCSAGDLVSTQKGKFVFFEGEKGDAFYFIARGLYSVQVGGHEIGRLGTGEFFGEIAVLTGRTRSASIQSLEPGVLFRLSSEQFWTVLTDHFELALRMELVSNSRSRELEDRIDSAAGGRRAV